MNISICIPSRNNRPYLELAYNSIRKTQGNHFVEILVLDDISDKDDTWEWCEGIMAFDLHFKAFKNNRKERLGISSGYKFLSQQATQEVICHFHADMVMTEGTLDAVENELFPIELLTGNVSSNPNVESIASFYARVSDIKKVICLTRIEPPIYNDPGIYPEKIIWSEAPIRMEDWNESFFTVNLPHLIKSWGGKKTGGHFAPFFMFRAEYLRLGGMDTDCFPKQAREDSCWGFRLILDGFETIQIPQMVFHFASRGNRRSEHESGNFKDNPEWQEIEKNSVRNFARKYQTMNLHDSELKPRKISRFHITFIIKNCNPDLLYHLEPWCDSLANDLSYEDNLKYIELEQPNTKFDLKAKIANLKRPEKQTEITVEIDGRTFDRIDFQCIQNLSEFIDKEGEIGEFEWGHLRIKIAAMNHYENDLIICKNEPIQLS